MIRATKLSKYFTCCYYRAKSRHSCVKTAFYAQLAPHWCIYNRHLITKIRKNPLLLLHTHQKIYALFFIWFFVG
jgi:arginine/ornithine N-succinyltransferase beta subunit